MTLTENRVSSVAFDPRTPEFLENPYPRYAQLRAEQPVQWSPTGDVWLTRYGDVQLAFRDRRFGKSAPAYAARSSALGGEAVPPSMLFTPRIVERLRPRISVMVEELLERAGDAFDLVERFAFPLPAMVIAELLPLAAGHETTVSLVANGVVTLAFHPVEWARLRDPSVFGEPDRLDLTREPNPHLAFGHGIHFCLDPALARMEGELALSGLVARFGHIEVSGPVTRGITPMFRSIRQLGVRCRA